MWKTTALGGRNYHDPECSRSAAGVRSAFSETPSALVLISLYAEVSRVQSVRKAHERL